MNPPSSRPTVAVLRLLVFSLLLAFLAVPAGHAQEKKGKGKSRSGKGGGVPPVKEVNELVRATLLDVDKGLTTQDFSQLHANLSPTWRKQISKDQLMAIFTQQLVNDQRTDYVASLDPVYDPAPFIDPNGLLVAGGHYPSEPQWVIFRVKYRQEAGGWKPFGIAVRVQNAKSDPPPPTRLPEKETAATAAAAAAAAAAKPSPAAPATSPSPAAFPSPAASPSPSPATTPGVTTPTPAPTPSASPAVSPR